MDVYISADKHKQTSTLAGRAGTAIFQRLDSYKVHGFLSDNIRDLIVVNPESNMTIDYIKVNPITEYSKKSDTKQVFEHKQKAPEEWNTFRSENMIKLKEGKAIPYWGFFQLKEGKAFFPRSYYLGLGTPISSYKLVVGNTPYTNKDLNNIIDILMENPDDPQIFAQIKVEIRFTYDGDPNFYETRMRTFNCKLNIIKLTEHQ